MPWFLNPNIYNKLPVYQNPELYLFVFKLAATAFFGVLLWKSGVSLRRLIGTTYIFFYGTFITVMLFMHNTVILGLRIFDRPNGDSAAYDFHLYSLILLGSVLIFQGVRSLRAALMLKAGNENGIREARRAALIVLAVAVPLIPLQFFGMVLTLLSLLNLAAIKLLSTRAATIAQTDVEKKLAPA
jgi:hypothetical protein